MQGGKSLGRDIRVGAGSFAFGTWSELVGCYRVESTGYSHVAPYGIGAVVVALSWTICQTVSRRRCGIFIRPPSGR